MDNISFTKMSGAGNDFIVIDKSRNPELVLTNNVIKRLCGRRNGVGADGIMIITDAEGYDFQMDYYNSDGSTGSLCANGARCALKFAKSSGRIKNKKASFLSNNTAFTGELLSNGLVRFDLKPPAITEKKIVVQAEGLNISANFADTGSPHIVIDIEELGKIYPDNNDLNSGLSNFPVVKFGREIRNSSEFAPGGTNVNFIKHKNGVIHIRTYERGVEDETLACGTGAVASAIFGARKYNLHPPVKLVTRGNDELFVGFSVDGSVYKNVSLTGPAVEVFSGEINLNIFS
jgi:diaminopimelate epimerase